MRTFFGWEERLNLYRAQEVVVSEIFAHWLTRILVDPIEVDSKDEIASPRTHGVRLATMDAVVQVIEATRREADELSASAVALDGILKTRAAPNSSVAP